MCCTTWQFVIDVLFKSRQQHIPWLMPRPVALQLLGLNGRPSFPDSEVIRAYEDLMNATLEAGYSSQGMQARNRVLTLAKEYAISNKGRLTQGAARHPGGGLPHGCCRCKPKT